MVKKRNQARACQDVAKAAERENRRGRTVLAMVGRAIQNGTKIPVAWNHRRLPCGDYKNAFCSYIGVVVRERVNINYRVWDDLPKEVLNEVYEFITVSIYLYDPCFRTITKVFCTH